MRRRFYQRPSQVRIPADMVTAVEREAEAVHLDVAYNPQQFLPTSGSSLT